MNPLGFATVSGFESINSTTVALFIDLNKHPELSHPTLVQVCMNQYASMPNVHDWRAEMDIQRQVLTIIVTGTINQAALARYADLFKE